MTTFQTLEAATYSAIANGSAFDFFNFGDWGELSRRARYEGDSYHLTELKEVLIKAATIEKEDETVVPHAADTIEKGAILYSCWGYEQTNVNFFVVVRCTAKTAWILPMTDDRIFSEYLSGSTMPSEIEWHEDVQRRKITDYGSKPGVSGGRDRQNLYLWDGRAKAFSSYA